MRKIYAILLALVATVAIQAQVQDNAMYVYRNDGSFNAFLREDIDSITLSHFDFDSIRHKVPVCQVFYTIDSIYRIPIEAIDSVSFVQPETKYTSGVVRIDEWMPYLSSVDTTRLAVSFKPTLPFTAKKGDVLFYPVMDDENFPIGFAGKVVEIEKGDSIVFVCDSASIDDVFEQLLIVGKIVLSDEEPQQSQRKRINAEGGFQHAVSFPLKYSDDHFTLEETTTFATTVNVLLRKQPKMPFYAQISLGANVGIDLHVNAKYDSGEIQIPDDKLIGKFMTKPFIDLPIPNFPMVRFKVRAAPIVKLQGKVEFDANLHAKAESKVDIINNDGDVNSTTSCTASSSWDAKLNMDGTVFVGVRLYPYLTCVANMFTVSFKIDAGPKVEGNFVIDAGTSKSTYEALKDNKVTLYAGATFHIKPQFKILNWETGEEEKMSFTKSIFPKIKEWYLLPEFTEPDVKLTEDGHSLFAQCTPSRDLLMNVQLGFGLEDENGRLIRKQWCDGDYRLQKEWASNAMFQQLALSYPYNGDYTVYPYVRIQGYELKAKPSKDFFVGNRVGIFGFNFKSQYKENGFSHDGSTYSYEFNPSIVFSLMTRKNVEDWGYVYYDTKGKDVRVSLLQLGSHDDGNYHVDSLNVYYRNSIMSTITMIGYVKFHGDDKYYYDKPTKIILIPEVPSSYGSLCGLTIPGGFHLELEKTCPDDNHPHLIDLGLPSGTKWSCCNVGASKPDQKGGIYAWGETEEKEIYDSSTYQHWEMIDKNGDGIYDGYTRKINFDISGTQYDVAKVKWGGNWRMPRESEVKELLEKCLWLPVESMTYHYLPSDYIGWGLDGDCNRGFQIIGPNGNVIIFPPVSYGSSTPFGENGCIAFNGPYSDYIDGHSYDFESIEKLIYDLLHPKYDTINFETPEWGRSVRPVSE